MPEPIIHGRVRDFSELAPYDIVRATLTEHEMFGRPLDKISSQVEGVVRSTSRSADGNWSVVLELEGEVLTRTLKEHWTVEVLHHGPVARAKAVA